MQHLYGRILKPFHMQVFTTKYTSSLEVIHVNPSVMQASGQEPMMPDTFGLISQMELEQLNPAFAFLKTSRDTSHLDLEKSLESWNKLVTIQRGEYSQRMKSVHHIKGNGFLSWPTPRASEYKDCGPVGSKSHTHMFNRKYLCAVITGLPDQENNNSTGNHLEQLNPSWVKTLMGVPIGWTDCVYLETE